MPVHLDHPSRVARWREGAFEVLPEASTASQTVWFRIDPGMQAPGEDRWEGLLTQPADPGHAVVVAIPVFVDDVGLGDRVGVARQAGGVLVATHRVQDAGRFPFRVAFPDGAGDEAWRRLMRDLEPHGCWFDVYAPTLVGLSVDLEAVGPVTEHLDVARAAGRLEYEPGRTRPPR